MLRSIQVKDYMIQDPITVRPQDNLFDAVHKILVNKISGLCVVDEHKNLVGILSEMDCLAAVLVATYNERDVGKVSEFMTTNIVSVSSNDDIIAVAATMQRLKHRRLPVVENGRLVGQVTCRSLLRAVKMFTAESDAIEEQLY